MAAQVRRQPAGPSSTPGSPARPGAVADARCSSSIFAASPRSSQRLPDTVRASWSKRPIAFINRRWAAVPSTVATRSMTSTAARRHRARKDCLGQAGQRPALMVVEEPRRRLARSSRRRLIAASCGMGRCRLGLRRLRRDNGPGESGGETLQERPAFDVHGASPVKFGHSSTADDVLPSRLGADPWHRRATRHTTSSSWARARLAAGRRNVVGSRRQGRARRGRAPASPRRLPRAPPSLRPAVRQPLARGAAAHAAATGRLLRLHGAQRRLVRQRRGGAVHDAGGQAVQLAGPAASGRRPDQRVGPAKLSAQRAGPEGTQLRRRGRRLAVDLRGPGPLLRTGRRLRRHQRTGRRRAGAARRPAPAADADDVRRDQTPGARQTDARPDDHDWPHRQSHPSNQRAQRLPLLRPVRTRLRHAVVLQLGVHDRPRCDGHRPLHARHQRDGASGGDGRRPPARRRRPLCRSPDPRDPRSCGPGPWCCVPRPSNRRASSSIRRRASSRTAWPTRAARWAVTSWTTSGWPAEREGDFPDLPQTATLDRPVRPNAPLCHPVPEHDRWPTQHQVRAWIRLPGRRARRLQLARPGLRRRMGAHASRTASCRFA